MNRNRELLELHLDALYTRDAVGCLLTVRKPEAPPAPRFVLCRSTDGEVARRYRGDVDRALRDALEEASAELEQLGGPAIAEERAAAELARYAEILSRAAPVQEMGAGPAFCFPADVPVRYGAHDGAITLVTEANAAVLEPLLPDWEPDVRLSPPLLAFVIDGAAVSVCASARITARAHEAGVETAPAFRGRGYAPMVVAAWARAVRVIGAEPMYSTAWQNAASRAVARKLNLVQFGSDLHLT